MSPKTAVLVIDVQDSFFHRPYYEADQLPVFQEKLTKLLAGAASKDIPILHVFHVEPEGHFSIESGLVKPMDWLPDNAAAVFYKHVHNAFTETRLQAWLIQEGITRLVITGIRTEQCCETTTRVACDLGFEVLFASEATMTFSMTHANGRVYRPSEIRERTELVLDGRFAQVVTVEETLAML